MVVIEDKALNYAKQKNGNFLVTSIAVSGGCCSMDVRELSVEFIKDKPVKEKIYNSYDYNGVNVFIEKGLKVNDNVMIYQKAKLPFIGEIFGTKGISVKYL